MIPQVRRFKLICRAHWLAQATFAAAVLAVLLFLLAMGCSGWLGAVFLAHGCLVTVAVGIGYWRYRRDLREVEKIEQDYGLDGWPRVTT